MLNETYEAVKRLIEVYQQAGVVYSGKHYTTINELTDQVPALRPSTMEAAVHSLTKLGPSYATKVLGEEDKGAVLAAGFARVSDLPLAMARRYSYILPTTLASYPVDVDMEYDNYQLMVNGVLPGDVVSFVDDTLATGGTAVSLIKAVHKLGARVLEMRVVVEKLGMGGRKRIYEECGVEVQSVLGIYVSESGVVVRTAFDRSLERSLRNG